MCGHRIVRWMIPMLLVGIFMAGCATSPRYKGVAEGGNAENVLGVVTEADFTVITVEAGSAAETAGVQSGDVLVSLTWILSEAPEELPTAANGENNTSEAQMPIATHQPPAGVVNKTILFSQAADVHLLIGYSIPLRLQLTRDGSLVELTIIPLPLPAQPDQSTPTPLADGELYF